MGPRNLGEAFSVRLDDNDSAPIIGSVESRGSPGRAIGSVPLGTVASLRYRHSMDFMTIDEIRSRWTAEWVLVGDPELTDSLTIVRGQVLWHSPNRDEVYRKARELRPQHSAILYTGTLPDEAAVVLCLFRSTRSTG